MRVHVSLIPAAHLRSIIPGGKKQQLLESEARRLFGAEEARVVHLDHLRPLLGSRLPLGQAGGGLECPHRPTESLDDAIALLEQALALFRPCPPLRRLGPLAPARPPPRRASACRHGNGRGGGDIRIVGWVTHGRCHGAAPWSLGTSARGHHS